MIRDQKRDAELLRLGLITGTHTVADAVAWADRVIAADPHPDIEVIDVAMATRRRPVEVASLLGRVRGDVDPALVARQWLAALHAEVVAVPRKAQEVATLIYRAAAAGILPEEMTSDSDCWGLDEAFEFMKYDEAVRAVLDFLARHGASSRRLRGT